VHLPSVWLRVGGVAVAGATVIACATNASADGTPAATSHPAGATATRGAASNSGAAGASSGTAGSGTAGSGTRTAGSGTAGSGTGSAAGSAGDVSAAPPTAQEATLARLSVRQLAGQRVIYSYKGLNPPARLLYLIRHGRAAGVIFFGNNISSKAQIAAVCAKLETAAASKDDPVRSALLLMTDQEGGQVRRLPGAPDLSEKEIGNSAHPAAAATAAGRSAAKNLRSAGMNLNLAPVLDVFRKAGDFDDQFQRSYSKSAHKVSYLGADFIKAQQAGKVAATAKHFPGLGAASASQNTDARPVTLHVSLAKLRGTDERPYKAAIAAKVKLVMVSWAVYPSVGSTRPAGLSSKVVQGELRQRLGFTGVTITDALEAGALKPYGSTQNRAVLAAGAGMDLLLCAAQSSSQGDDCLNGLTDGYNNGSLSKTAFKAADTRILNLRAGLPR
jgi:beta-N-acetylhexosaminidase